MAKHRYKKLESSKIQGICVINGCENKQVKNGRGGYKALCSSCNKEIFTNKEKMRISDRKRLYNLDDKDYNDMLSKNDNKCYICDTKTDDLKKGLCIDHCHITGNIRGLLCHNCNTALGFFKDNIFILEKAIEYLKKFK